MLNYILIITGLDAVIARHDEEGASAVEYGLLVAGIAALVVGDRLPVRRGHQRGLQQHLRRGCRRRRDHSHLLIRSAARWNSNLSSTGPLGLIRHLALLT